MGCSNLENSQPFSSIVRFLRATAGRAHRRTGAAGVSASAAGSVRRLAWWTIGDARRGAGWRSPPPSHRRTPGSRGGDGSKRLEVRWGGATGRGRIGWVVSAGVGFRFDGANLGLRSPHLRCF